MKGINGVRIFCDWREKGAAPGPTDNVHARRLMGVFDDHATDNERVSV